MTHKKQSKPKGEELMQTTFRIPRGLHRRVVVKCAQVNQSLASVVVDSLRQFVGEKKAA